MTTQQRTTARRVVLMVLVMAGAATAQTVTLRGIDGRQITVRASALSNFAPSDAQTAVGRILEKAGLKANFKVVPTNDPAITNAAAMLDEQGTTRYILYAPAFMEAVSRGGQGSWAATGVLAHEIGHHLNAHTMTRTQLTAEVSRQQELDADEFAGTQLARLGASQSDALAMLAGLPDVESFSHPRRSAREVVVLRGWCAGSGRPALGFAAAAPSSNATTCGSGNGSMPVPAVTADLVAYDFAAPVAAVPPRETDLVTMQYAYGGYTMFDKPADGGPHFKVFETLLPDHVEIEVTAQVAGGAPEGGSWGVAFGENDSSSPLYVVFLHAGSGQIGIMKFVGRTQMLVGNFVERASINRATAARNTVTVRLNGQVAEVLVNGVQSLVQELSNSGKMRMGLVSGGHPPGVTPTTIVFFSARATPR